MNHWSVLIGHFVYRQVLSGKRWVGVLNRIVINTQQEMHVHLHSRMFVGWLLVAFFPPIVMGLV